MSGVDARKSTELRVSWSLEREGNDLVGLPVAIGALRAQVEEWFKSRLGVKALFPYILNVVSREVEGGISG